MAERTSTAVQRAKEPATPKPVKSESLLDRMNEVFSDITKRQCGSGNHSRSVLVIVHHGNRHGVAQCLFNDEAVWRPDVFEIDSPDGRLEKLAKLNEVLRLIGLNLKIKHVDVRETFEEHGLAFHDRLSSQWHRRDRQDGVLFGPLPD